MQKYYSLKRIDKMNCDYNIIFGERSNGKTYSVLEKILKNYIAYGQQGAYIRRWQDDLLVKRCEVLFSNFTGLIKDLTNNEYDRVVYFRGKWYLAIFDENERKLKKDSQEFCHSFALSSVEHDKSTQYPKVTTICFDEFLTRRYYLPDEFINFLNVISTIIRERNNVKIYMLGNTVNQYCPYFEEMGLIHIQTQKQGTIDEYTFSNNLKIAVEYCAPLNKSKPSDKFFSFDNPRVNMITKGKWEIDIYPHLPIGYKILHNDIVFSFGVSFNHQNLSIDVINKDTDIFLFCHKKTTEYKYNDLVYSLDYTPSPYRRKTWIKAIDKIDLKIQKLINANRIFYADNVCGEILKNFLLTSIQ